MGGDFAGCTSIRKKSSSGGSGNSSSNGSVGGSNNNSNSSSSNKNDSAGGVLIPVHHYKDPLKTYKIVILGDGGVGKSGEILGETVYSP